MHHRIVPENVSEKPSAPAAGVPRVTLPRRLVFRVPGSALVVAFFLVLCESALAFASIWLTLLYVLPVAIGVWVVRTRTTVDADRIVVRRVFHGRELAWSEVASLRVRDDKWVRAVLTGGGEVTLPCVRTRHLPALALVSGGRISDPTEPAEEPEAGEPASESREN